MSTLVRINRHVHMLLETGKQEAGIANACSRSFPKEVQLLAVFVVGKSYLSMLSRDSKYSQS